ncbi:uncharacterized protein LOC142143926 [Mixophyes fleayi]|uniref:uncharacterized protein LOC142143926 n=1 Tax=Mixophyes fleayi TaxID=3061075 RepID=UPI003F4DE6FC
MLHLGSPRAVGLTPPPWAGRGLGPLLWASPPPYPSPTCSYTHYYPVLMGQIGDNGRLPLVIRFHQNTGLPLEGFSGASLGHSGINAQGALVVPQAGFQQTLPDFHVPLVSESQVLVGGVSVQPGQLGGGRPSSEEVAGVATESRRLSAAGAAGFLTGPEAQQTGAMDVSSVPGPSGAAGAGQPVVTGAGGSNSSIISVWVLGHSYIFWASRHPLSRNCHWLADNVHIRWIGKRGLKWDNLLPLLSEEILSCGVPDVLVVHAGGNDVGQIKTLEFIIRIREDTYAMSNRWPNIKLCWSCIVPRRHWRSGMPAINIGAAVCKINQVASKIFCSVGGSVIKHPLLIVESPFLYRFDGVHLSDEGVRLFIDQLFWRLRGVVRSVVGGPHV